MQYQGTFSLKNSSTRDARHIPSVKFTGASVSQKKIAKTSKKCYAVLTPEQERYFTSKSRATTLLYCDFSLQWFQWQNAKGCHYTVFLDC